MLVDMMLISDGFSTAWCEGHSLISNYTAVSAVLVDGDVKFEDKPRTHSVLKHFKLGKNQREHWGFYLPS